MNLYKLRINFTSTYLQESKKVRGKLAFKTKETDWLNTKSPVIALVSTHSSFHEGINGELKMEAFMGTIKNNVEGKVSVLIADTAHYHAQNERSFDECVESGSNLVTRYQSYFEGCDILYWHSFICRDDLFAHALARIEHLAEIDPAFQEHLLLDAEATYTTKRSGEFQDRAVFIERASRDIMEQCASLFVLVAGGYRYQLYPGASFKAVEYVNELFFPIENRLHWINIFLTIEKKIYF